MEDCGRRRSSDRQRTSSSSFRLPTVWCYTPLSENRHILQQCAIAPKHEATGEENEASHVLTALFLVNVTSNIKSLQLGTRCTVSARFWPVTWATQLILESGQISILLGVICAVQSGGEGANDMLLTGHWMVGKVFDASEILVGWHRLSHKKSVLFLTVSVLGDKLSHSCTVATVVARLGCLIGSSLQAMREKWFIEGHMFVPATVGDDTASSSASRYQTLFW